MLPEPPPAEPRQGLVRSWSAHRSVESFSLRAARRTRTESKLPASSGMSRTRVSLTKPDSCTRSRSTITDGRGCRFLVASASCIAVSKWAMVADMPHTIGMGGRALVPLTSRRTIVGFSEVVLALKPRCASSSTRYRVRSSASMVFASVSQMVQPCMSGAATAKAGKCSCPSGAVSTCPRVSREVLVSFWVFRK